MPSKVNRRIVAEDRDGLFTIHGLDTEFGDVLPSLIEMCPFGDRMASASMIKANSRYVLYREIVEPEEAI